MRIVIERIPHALFLFLPWTLSVYAFTFIYQQFGIGECQEINLFSFSCLPFRSEISISSGYLIISIFFILIIFFVMFYFHRKIASPFVYFMSSTIFISSFIDYLLDPHIQQLGKLFNDSYFVISFIITLSFLIILFIIDNIHAAQINYIIACFVSHFSKTISFLTCSIFNIYIDGMTALFMLFFIFSFGTFSLHIMSIASIFEGADIDKG